MMRLTQVQRPTQTSIPVFLTIVGLLVIAPFAAFAQTSAPTSQPASAPASPEAMMNTVCPVMHEPVNPNIHIQYQGRTVGFCCRDCISTFQSSPEHYAQGLPQFQTNVASAAPPNTTCPVMVGRAVNPDIHVDYQGRRIFFCCNHCPQTFMANPEQYLSNLPAAGPAPHGEQHGQMEMSHESGHEGAGHMGDHH